MQGIAISITIHSNLAIAIATDVTGYRITMFDFIFDYYLIYGIGPQRINTEGLNEFKNIIWLECLLI